MIVRDLYEFQRLVFRVYMQSVMFLVTLPYYLTQEWQRPDRDFRREDVRWLR
jgi:hypothetical protein